MTRRVIARQDPSLRASVVRVTPLHYATGADRSLDRPAHVRAGSGIAWVGRRLIVVQDDANFIALVDPTTGEVDAVTLPAGVDGRRQFGDTLGNKAHKLDLEAVVSVPDSPGGTVVLAFGSGSTNRRETVVSLDRFDDNFRTDDVRGVMHLLPAFYAALREAVAFSGSELNVEAVVYLGPRAGGRLRLFNRGNGALRAGLAGVNATCEVNWVELTAYLSAAERIGPPLPYDIVQYDLGTLGGHALSFTDAAVASADADGVDCRIVYTAAAEASPDTYSDGPVAGSAVGVIVEGAGGSRARWAILHDDEGAPFMGKVEGIALHPGDKSRAYLVVDCDSPDQPSELCEVKLDGDWFAGH